MQSQIGPYIIERELGSGGMGTVFLAHHTQSERQAAVKVLPAALSREPGFVARFNREISALQTVHSPHIVELYDSGVDGEIYYYAMEYVAGESLTERLDREQRLPWRTAIEIAVQVCRALKAAHNAGVIHRDLKPSNLMLAEGDAVKLTDFGVAQIFAGGKLTATGGVVGTAEFMSPEQAEGKRATKQSDIYALGAVLYVMLTGRPPFTGKTALDIAQKHRFGQFDSPKRFVPEIPAWLDEVVCKCLAKNPDQRYPDAYVLSLRLQEIPRKVDLSGNDDEHAEDAPDLSAETLASNAPVAAGPGVAGELGGTFVRDVVRAELDKTTTRSTFEHWLDSTWVLVLLLVAVIAGGAWLYDRRTIDPEQVFSAGETLMASTDRSDWLQADREHFQPLLMRDAAVWDPRVAPYRPRIALAEAEQGLLRRLRRSGLPGAPPSEPLRILSRISRDLETGDWAAARTRLEALQQVLPDDASTAAERDLVADLLEHLPAAPSVPQNPLIDDALTRAERLASEGHTAEARTIWAGLIALYSDDLTAADAVRQAQQRLHNTPLAREGP